MVHGNHESKPLHWHGDAVHAGQLFPSDNPYGIPTLQHAPIARIPIWLVPYRTRVRSDHPLTGGAVHFFIDDYRFDTTWSKPRKTLNYLEQFDTLLTPDFSLYRNWPLAIQMWNTYRNRWCGAYWQSLGFTVIPTVSWSTSESYAFAFCGIPQRSLVALSTIGVKRGMSHPLFMAGFREMVQRLNPSVVLCYGQPNPDMERLAAVKVYDYWRGLRHARRGNG